MGPEGVRSSYWEYLIFCIEHSKIYMNIIKSSVRIIEVLVSEVLLYLAIGLMEIGYYVHVIASCLDFT